MLESSGRDQRLQIIGAAAAGIAHDINNQLTLIVNHLLISDITGASAAVARCSELTASLLAFCRGEMLQLQDLDLSSFLIEFSKGLRLPSGVELIVEVPEGLAKIKADPVAITRVLTNLVSNAQAAMEGRGAIRIAASNGTIQIGDTGPGVPDAIRNCLFEPFFTTKGSAGSGLGLSIAREIMRQHGGSVTLDAYDGAGANFVLRFPLA